MTSNSTAHHPGLMPALKGQTGFPRRARFTLFPLRMQNINKHEEHGGGAERRAASSRLTDSPRGPLSPSRPGGPTEP
ncbi:hypothetical protein EYF80_022843 [Liparis tanakae]|uniref:Uncharacterized protein n=1 Tax=Liparis tanakae TaxID=230148 RepID=A0A4Z2HM62_9TELE|nr:hypothetical protein EYF80_022843 [Liparis tanakae]